jgi:UDP-glucose 4-epimerase
VWFAEETPRITPPASQVERSLLEVEGYVRDFAEDNPHVTVSLLRFSNVLGTDISTPISRALELPVAVPAIFGFDPRFQFVEEDDVIRSILYVLEHHLPGVYNVAGDGQLPWSEVASITGKQLFYLPPYGTELAAAALRAARIFDQPPELLALLRHGRGVDNRRLQRAGFRYNYTSAGAVESFAKSMRLRRTVGESRPAYTYERDAEAFFRHSPAVVRDPE